MAANIAWIRKSEESRLLFEGEAARCRLSLDGLIFDLLEDHRQKHFEALFTVHRIQEVMAERSIPMKILANPLRVLVCRADRTPQIDRTLCLIGRDKVLARIAEGLA